MALVIYNTLTKQKEEFRPLHENFVGMYVCGPTVYGHSHLGHAKSYVSFDVIVRYLRFVGYRVLYVQNITDVGHLTDDADEGEDKIEKQSRAERVHPMQLAELFTNSYFEDMDALNVRRADIAPRASGHITEQISLVQELLRKGVAYEVNGSVYFDVRKFAEYGKLSRRTFDEMESGTRVEVNPEKRFPADFALWKKAEAGHIMRWPSPWGEGFPGWHLECSAMSMKYLGLSFDIHGGGLENQFPHHECEIAQSEAATSQPFVRYWVHNNMVTRDGRKMGKSLGNSLTLKDAFTLWPPQVVRFFILQSHYRSTLDFSDAAVGGASRGLEKLVNTVRNVRNLRTSVGEGNAESGVDLKKYEGAFIEAMNDDFNTPQAIAALFDCSRDVNQAIADGRLTSRSAVEQINTFFTVHATQILGITFDEGDRTTGSTSAEPDLLKLFIALRADLRKEKLWSLSDKIRDGLAALGYVLEDKKDETSWKKVETPTAQ